MTLIHLLVGVGVVVATAAAALTLAAGRPIRQVTSIAGWALALLVVQVASGMFLFTATNAGPGSLHVVAALAALVLVAAVRLLRPEPAGGDAPILGAVYAVATVGALAGLVTGLTVG